MIHEDVLSRLLRRRSLLRLKARIQSQEQIYDSTRGSPSFTEDADAALDALGLAPHTELQLIDGALLRLRLGSYGVCELCNRPIEAPRLQAEPYGLRCVACAPSPG